MRSSEEWRKTADSGKALEAWHAIIVRNSRVPAEVPPSDSESVRQRKCCAPFEITRPFYFILLLFLTHPDFDSMIVTSSDLSLIPSTDWTYCSMLVDRSKRVPVEDTHHL
jgi:hypothetical protein